MISQALKEAKKHIDMIVPGPLGSVGEAVKVLRKVKGMTGEALAETSGLARGTVSEIENGKGNVTIDTICRLAGALDIRPGDLLNAVE